MVNTISLNFFSFGKNALPVTGPQDLIFRLAQGLAIDLYELFAFVPEEVHPRLLRKKLERLIAEVKEEELARMVRILEALVH